MVKMIAVKEAQNKILNMGKMVGTAKVPILDSLGLVLAEDIMSDDDIPVYDNSAMDGFAVRAEDTKGAEQSHPVRLNIMGKDIAAGKMPEQDIEQGCCVPIMTGAPIPGNCTAVVMKEDTKITDSKTLIYKQCEKGENIRYRGEDIKKGDKVLKKGKKIYPADIGVLASLGKDLVPAYKPPVVGIISTGDEVVSIDSKLEAGRVRDSNSYSLAAQLKEMGITYFRYGIVKDRKRFMEEKIREGLSQCNILLLSGGVSVGDYDYVKDTLLGLGAELVFWKVNQKPGKPLLFLTYGDRLVFGLPGNPVSVMVCFEMYVRPLIKKIMGDSELFRPTIRARAAHDFKHKGDRTNFARVILAQKEDGCYFSSTGMQGSGILTSMAKADGIAVFDETEAGNIKKGREAEVYLLKTPGRIQCSCR